jgi:hypothetical protein
MPRTQSDPLGAGFWSPNAAQCDFSAALSTAPEYRRLRDVIAQMRQDSAREIGSNLNWLKFCIAKITEIDLTRRDNVYIRRGERWQQWWDANGQSITERQLAAQGGPIDIDLSLDL